MNCPSNTPELEDLLSTPTPGAIEALSSCPGDVIVLGAGGKVGPSLARMLRRAADAAGGVRRITAVSRFSSTSAADELERHGVDVLRADISNRDVLTRLPDVPNVFFLVGQKFGTRDAPEVTWQTNVVVPALVAERYQGARLVVLSTGNVYPLVPVSSGGSRETDPPAPAGEYAWTCLGRERVFAHAAVTGTRVAIVRLNYAVDLRYGVLVDVAVKVRDGSPIDLRMGHANVIWQGDACAQVIQCLQRADRPPFIVNITGGDLLSIRAAALELGRLLGTDPVFAGSEAPDALLSNTARAQQAFGPTRVSTATLIEWVAEWIRQGGEVLGKATHFEEREGRF